MASGYTLVSDAFVQNLKEHTDEIGIQIKLGFGTPAERLNQINRNSQIKFIKLCENNVSSKDDETKFRHCFQFLFNLKPRENSNEEFFVPLNTIFDISAKYEFDTSLQLSKIDYVYFIIQSMINKTKDNYINFSEEKNSRKRGRKPDDDSWLTKCAEYKLFFGRNKRKPQSKHNQMITKREFVDDIDEYEAKLSNWYNNAKQNKLYLSSVRRMQFDDLEDYIYDVKLNIF